MEVWNGREGGREAGDGGRAGLEGREEGEGGNRGKFFLVTRSCEAGAVLEGGREGGIKGGRGKVAVGVACCERSEHSH